MDGRNDHNTQEEQLQEENIIQQSNKPYPVYNSELQRPKFKLWFVWLATISTAGTLLIFRMSGIPALSVPCILDKGHELLEPLNRMCNDNQTFGHGIIILSSLSIDFVALSCIGFWIVKCRSLRLAMVVLMFYAVRTPHIYLYTPRFPDGYFFEYPGFPSLTVPYGRQSDFFFSGHSGIITIMYLEWRVQGYKKMQYISGILLCYVIFSLLVLRVHYTIDITCGVMFAHYLFTMAQHFENKVNFYAHRLQNWISIAVFKKEIIDKQN